MQIQQQQRRTDIADQTFDHNGFNPMYYRIALLPHTRRYEI